MHMLEEKLKTISNNLIQKINKRAKYTKKEKERTINTRANLYENRKKSKK